MKKSLIIIAVFAILLPSNGCRILKHKTKQTNISSLEKQNDISVIKSKIDSVALAQKYFYDKSNSTLKETITYKAAQDDGPIELTGTFKIDTAKSLKGDTALTLTGNGVSLTITRNPITNTLTANIKSGGKTRKVPFNEMTINRTITDNRDVTDTSKASIDIVKSKIDSVDRSFTKNKIEISKVDKNKDTKPTLGTFGIIVGIAIVIGFFVWLGFRK